MNTLSHKQLTAFLETTSTSLDLTDFSKCISYLYGPEGEEIARIDNIKLIDYCENTIWIDEDEYTLTSSQKDFIISHFAKEIQDDLQTWQEMKNDTYNVRDDQNNY